MRRKAVRSVIVVISLLLSLFYQGCQNLKSIDLSSRAQRNNNKNATFYRYGSLQFGVTYYPEQRTPSEWITDFKILREAGIERIRIGEFAWSSIEPKDSIFNWGWLDKCIGLAQKNNLDVVLCTPTAAPPIWLVEQHPEVMPVDEEGHRMVFGASQHRCYNSQAYLIHAKRIAKLLVKRYGEQPNVVEWQIDKWGRRPERCYCDLCMNKFQQYLADKYVSIEELNKRWGNAFWSMDYQSFNQINPPLKCSETIGLKHHPSLQMEYARFTAQNVVAFYEMQARTIADYTDSPITINGFTCNRKARLNSSLLYLSLDAVSSDLNNMQLHELAFHADLKRSLNPDKSWFMEYGVNSKKLEKELQLMHSRGVEWVYFSKFNACPWGQEQSLSELTTITGNPTENFKLISHYKEQRNQDSIVLKQSKVGLYYDFESSQAYLFNSKGANQQRLDYQDYMINTVYKSLYNSGDEVIQIYFSPTQNFNVDVLIFPMQIIYSPSLEQKILEFLASGGTVIVTHDFFQKNQDNVYLTRLPEIYKSSLQINDNFIESPDHETVILREENINKGEIIMVNGQATLTDWKKIANSIFN